MEIVTTHAGWEFLFRWLHFMAGITWIGLLYYFNFVQTPFFAETEAGVRTAAISKLVPRALWWFRWGAMLTLIAGLLIYLVELHLQGGAFYDSPYGWLITLGGVLGIMMWFNVWFVIWPNQKVVIASAQQVQGGGAAIPEAAARGRRAGLTSRTNVVFSLPMLFFMGAARHLPLAPRSLAGSANHMILPIACAAIVALVEANALVGTQGPTKKPLDSVVAAIHTGLGLTAVFYLLFAFLY